MRRSFLCQGINSSWSGRFVSTSSNHRDHHTKICSDTNDIAWKTLVLFQTPHSSMIKCDKSSTGPLDDVQRLQLNKLFIGSNCPQLNVLGKALVGPWHDNIYFQNTDLLFLITSIDVWGTARNHFPKKVWNVGFLDYWNFQAGTTYPVTTNLHSYIKKMPARTCCLRLQAMVQRRSLQVQETTM